MIVSTEEMKNYLRVDFSDDDALIEQLLAAARELCMDIMRTDDEDDLEQAAAAKVAVMYAAAHLYEHREAADHRLLRLTLRALLSGNRRSVF